jgi:AcrR family transcriptional regulator
VPRLAAEEKQERRQALIDAARRRAVGKGFAELTVEEVCAEAGVSKGAFYIYFESKQELLLALLDEGAASVDGAMRSGTASGIEALRVFIRAMVRRGEDPATVQIEADLWAALLTDDGLRTRFSEQVSDRRSLLRASIEEAVEAGELIDAPANALASILLALGDGLTLHGGLDPGAFKWTNIRRALDTILEGLAPS